MEEFQKTEFVLKTMKKVLEMQAVRLQRGVRLRQELQDALRKGETPTGYRVGWLRDSGYEIISLLNKIAVKFDKEHTSDKASAQDLMDILSTAMHILKKAINTHTVGTGGSNQNTSGKDEDPEDEEIN